MLIFCSVFVNNIFHNTSHEEEGTSIEDASANGGPRWRSDDTSEDDEQQSPFPNGFGGNGGGHSISMRRARRSRFAMK